ncbi:hypothetical protein GCM10027293_18790 [Pontibacter aydingkolensis]
MQELKRLVEIIADNTPKVLPVIDQFDNVSLEGKLYNIIKDSRSLTDKEACLYLYGEDKLTPSYRMLKSRLRKKLLNSLILTEISESHLRLYRIHQAECLTLIQQANKLMMLGDYTLADKLTDQVIVIAEKAELNDILAKAYEVKQHFVLLSNDRDRFEKTLGLLKHYYYLDSKEREANILYNELKFEVSINISNSRKQGATYTDKLLKLKELWESTGSSYIYDYYHMLHIGHCEIYGDYEGIILAIEEAEDLNAKGLINDIWVNHRFHNYIKVYAYLRLGQYTAGLHYAKLYLSSFQKGSNNWFAFLENYLILALHSKNYGLALEISKTASENDLFNNLLPRFKEMLGLLLRYTQLLVQDQSLDISYETEYRTLIISKDKEGLNLPLLILEYLEDLPKLDTEDMEQYIARFSKYSSKYLKGEIWARARLFIRMLLLSMRTEGNKLQEKGAALLEELKNTPPPHDPVAEVEIVPYEHLWELVLELHSKRSQR